MAKSERSAISDKELKKITGWSDTDLKEFKRFTDIKQRREMRSDIRADTEELLNSDDELRERYDKTTEELNSIYREAWSRTCEKYEVTEREFPCHV